MGLFGALIIAGLLLRWIDLGYLPLHHDESIHAMFGQYFYDFPDIQYYKYDPEYHGPTLYMLLRPVYAALGSSDWAARSPIALLGSLSLFAPLVFRQYLKPVTVLYLTAFVSLSPSLVYWSRFVREDYIIFLGMFLVLYGATLAKSSARTFFIAVGIGLQWATKANIFVFLGILAGYIVFEFLFNRVVLKDDATPAAESALITSAIQNFRKYWVQCIGGLLAGGFVFSYLITSAFRHMDGIRDGLGLRGVEYLLKKPFHLGDANWLAQWGDAIRHDVLLYWLDKHNIERIQGPFNFHLYQLSWYELLFICVFITHLFFFYFRAGTSIKLAAGAVWAIAITFFCSYYISGDSAYLEYGFWKFFKIKDAYDIIGVFLLSSHAIFVTCHHLSRRERALAFFGYFFTATLFSYSYLGEKVPWLSSYPLLAGYAYLALYFQDLWREKPLENWEAYPVRRVVIAVGCLSFLLGLLFSVDDGLRKNAPYFVTGLILPGIALADIYLPFLGKCNLKILSFLALCIFNLRLAIIASFPPKDKEMGYISQVHTTMEFRDAALYIRENIENQAFGSRVLVHVSGEASWPITWYYRGMPEYKFDNLTAEKRTDYAYIFDTWKDDDQSVPEGFVARRINLRGWWVPEFPQMTLKKFLNYSVNLEPWSGVGYTYVRLLTNKRILPENPPKGNVEGG